MEQTELSEGQKEIMLDLMCKQAVAQEKLQDIADTIELDSDLQVQVSCAALAVNTAKVRIQLSLLE